jgi:hypothetical protein
MHILLKPEKKVNPKEASKKFVKRCFLTEWE